MDDSDDSRVRKDRKKKNRKDRRRVEPVPSPRVGGGAGGGDTTTTSTSSPKTNGGMPMSVFQTTQAAVSFQKNNKGTLVEEPQIVPSLNQDPFAVETVVHAKSAGLKWRSFVNKKRKPLLKTASGDAAISREAGIAELDSDVEIDEDDSKVKGCVTSNQALLHYFSKLARTTRSNETIDFDFVENLIHGGASPNCHDKYGQTLMHEVARAWHPDVAEFLIRLGADLNRPCKFGRTPLHVAAAVNYPDMVEFLLKKGADIAAKTLGECQTPIHYAASNDAGLSLKILHKHGAKINVRDYKGRTPLQVSAELDRSVTARLLLDLGAEAGVQDNSGMSAIVLMISSMPAVAKEALDQFHRRDRANRKQYFYLNHLEHKKPAAMGADYDDAAKTALQVVVQYKQLELIQHPAFDRLIKVKWDKFAKFRASLAMLANVLFVLSWTALVVGVSVEKEDTYLVSYTPINQNIWRIIIGSIAVAQMIFQLVMEIREIFVSRREFKIWSDWRKAELQKDLEYIHPRWPEEGLFLKRELENVEQQKTSYLRDYWNVFDWITYAILVTVIISHLTAVMIVHTDLTTLIDSDSVPYFLRNNATTREEYWYGIANSFGEISIKIVSIGLVFVWVRVMKDARAFRVLGPFIVMLTNMLADCLRFLFVYLLFYIPFGVAYYVTFGTKGVSGYYYVDSLMYNMFQITMVGDFSFDLLTDIDRTMAYILTASFTSISAIVLLNLFIALMSDTFQRVYDNAQANAMLQQATIIQAAEESMSATSRDKFQMYIHTRCNPEILYYDDDVNPDGETNLQKVTIQIKEDLDGLVEHLKGDTQDQESLRTIKETVAALKLDVQDMKLNTDQTLMEISENLEQIRQTLQGLAGLQGLFQMLQGGNQPPPPPPPGGGGQGGFHHPHPPGGSGEHHGGSGAHPGHPRPGGQNSDPPSYHTYPGEYRYSTIAPEATMAPPVRPTEPRHSPLTVSTTPSGRSPLPQSVPRDPDVDIGEPPVEMQLWDLPAGDFPSVPTVRIRTQVLPDQFEQHEA